jgi:hypothetical protein
MTSNSLSMAAVDQPAAGVNRESSWQWLYKLGGAAALAAVLIIPITIIVYIAWPPPSTSITFWAPLVCSSSHLLCSTVMLLAREWRLSASWPMSSPWDTTYPSSAFTSQFYPFCFTGFGIS